MSPPDRSMDKTRANWATLPRKRDGTVRKDTGDFATRKGQCHAPTSIVELYPITVTHKVGTILESELIHSSPVHPYDRPRRQGSSAAHLSAVQGNAHCRSAVQYSVVCSVHRSAVQGRAGKLNALLRCSYTSASTTAIGTRLRRWRRLSRWGIHDLLLFG